MNNYDVLLAETAAEREAFLAIPILHKALEGGVDRDLYLAYLREAYHHVRHTCPLLALAMAHCTPDDDRLRAALLDYISEEQGHDAWILDDIAALGGDAESVKAARGGPAVRVMVGYATYAIERVSPYAMLGMVHVLEGVSAAIATPAARSIRTSIGAAGSGGFSYLESHGSLDLSHVDFFKSLVNSFDSPQTLGTIVDTARIMYRLFGDVFRDLDAGSGSNRNAA